MIETQWTAKLVNELKKCNARVLNIHGGPMQAPGWPDMLIIHRRFHGFVEVKNEKTQVTPLQRRRILDIKSRGFPAIVLRMPNKLEDENGNFIKHFDGTAINLLQVLRSIFYEDGTYEFLGGSGS